MKTFDTSIYPGKKEYDNFVASLPKDEELTQDEHISIAMQAAELLKKGIPHKDRPDCFYYFYHFLKFERDNTKPDNLPEQFKHLTEYVVSSLYDTNVLDYLKLLDGKRLYEVCQIRGELMMFNIGLMDNTAGKTKADWNDLFKKAEDYLKLDSCISRMFLDSYFDALVIGSKDSNNESRLYEIAKLTWDLSTDLDHLRRAWLYINDPKLIRTYKKNTLPAKEAKKIFNLEHVEKEVMAEFGEDFHGRTKVGKALQLLTKRGREQRKQLSIIRDEWYIKIKSHGGLSIMGDDPYVKGYAAYLKAQVCANTENWQKAIKELKTALDNNFDPEDVLVLLVALLGGMKKYDEAASFAQQFLDINSFLEEDQKEKYAQEILLVLKQADHKPLWANRIWETQAKENEQKIPSIISELESGVESEREANIEQRIKLGIEILDRLVSIDKADEALNNQKSLSEIKLESAIEDFLELSLEELEPFSNTDVGKLQNLYKQYISLKTLIKYNQEVIELLYGNFAENFDSALTNFPNTLACISVAKNKIENLLASEKQDFDRKLVDHLIDKRSNKIEGLYDSIKPIIELYHKQQNWRKEIEIISKARNLLHENEHKLATIDLVEAYFQLLTTEKSLNEKKRLLNSVESEQLTDERLSKIRKEVYKLLHKRKQMLIKIGIIVGAAVILFAVFYVLFL